jgi:hypothetical protein
MIRIQSLFLFMLVIIGRNNPILSYKMRNKCVQSIKSYQCLGLFSPNKAPCMSTGRFQWPLAGNRINIPCSIAV